MQLLLQNKSILNIIIPIFDLWNMLFVLLYYLPLEFQSNSSKVWSLLKKNSLLLFLFAFYLVIICLTWSFLCSLCMSSFPFYFQNFFLCSNDLSLNLLSAYLLISNLLLSSIFSHIKSDTSLFNSLINILHLALLLIIYILFSLTSKTYYLNFSVWVLFSTTIFLCFLFNSLLYISDLLGLFFSLFIFFIILASFFTIVLVCFIMFSNSFFKTLNFSSQYYFFVFSFSYLLFIISITCFLYSYLVLSSFLSVSISLLISLAKVIFLLIQTNSFILLLLSLELTLLSFSTSSNELLLLSLFSLSSLLL